MNEDILELATLEKLVKKRVETKTEALKRARTEVQEHENKAAHARQKVNQLETSINNWKQVERDVATDVQFVNNSLKK